jgi:hypothetical protein
MLHHIYVALALLAQASKFERPSIHDSFKASSGQSDKSKLYIHNTPRQQKAYWGLGIDDHIHLNNTAHARVAESVLLYVWRDTYTSKVSSGCPVPSVMETRMGRY